MALEAIAGKNRHVSQGLGGAVLLKARNQELNRIAHVIGLALDHGGATDNGGATDKASIM
jgi:hypothetical protein